METLADQNLYRAFRLWTRRWVGTLSQVGVSSCLSQEAPL